MNTDTKGKAMTAQAANTDRELYREPDKGNGSFYSDSIHVTEGGGIGINVGGHVIVMPLQSWHALATTPPAPQAEGEIERLRAENERLQTDFVAMAGHYNSQVMKNERLGSAQAPARTYVEGKTDQDFVDMLWKWFEDRGVDLRPERSTGLSANDFRVMLDEHEASLTEERTYADGIEDATKALGPFAKLQMPEDAPDDAMVCVTALNGGIVDTGPGVRVTVGDIRRAARALANKASG